MVIELVGSRVAVRAAHSFGEGVSGVRTWPGKGVDVRRNCVLDL